MLTFLSPLPRNRSSRNSRFEGRYDVTSCLVPPLDGRIYIMSDKDTRKSRNINGKKAVYFSVDTGVHKTPLSRRGRNIVGPFFLEGSRQLKVIWASLRFQENRLES